MEKRIDMAEKQVEKSREEVKKAIAAHNVKRIKQMANMSSFSGKRKERVAAYVQSIGGIIHE